MSKSELLHTVLHANVFHVQYLQARSGLAVRVGRSKFRAPDDVMSSVYAVKNKTNIEWLLNDMLFFFKLFSLYFNHCRISAKYIFKFFE